MFSEAMLHFLLARETLAETASFRERDDSRNQTGRGKRTSRTEELDN
jgi:hypothetical protein